MRMTSVGGRLRFNRFNLHVRSEPEIEKELPDNQLGLTPTPLKAHVRHSIREQTEKPAGRR